MSVTSIQSKASAFDSSGATLTLDSPATAGNLIIVTVFHSYTGCPPSVSNSESSTVITRISGTVNGGNQRVYTMIVAATGSYTVTITMTCGITRAFVVEEVSGFDTTTPIETVEYDIQTTTSASTIAVGPKNAAVGAGLRAVIAGASISAFTPTSGWTSPLNNSAFRLLQGKVAASTGAVSAAVGFTSDGNTVFGILYSIIPSAAATGKVKKNKVVKIQGKTKKFIPLNSLTILGRQALASGGMPTSNTAPDDKWFFRARRHR